MLRPPAQTGTRPKTTVASPAPSPAENTNTGGSVLTDDQVAANTEITSNFYIFISKEEVRKRRLAVFEEQKKRLMNKNK